MSKNLGACALEPGIRAVEMPSERSQVCFSFQEKNQVKDEIS